MLMGSPGILEVIKKPMPLVRDDKGVWSLTVGPLPPGFYTYGYAIDGGLRMPDPSNPNLECAAGGPTSLFIVPGAEKVGLRRTPCAAWYGARELLRFSEFGIGAHVLRLYASRL